MDNYDYRAQLAEIDFYQSAQEYREMQAHAEYLMVTDILNNWID